MLALPDFKGYKPFIEKGPGGKIILREPNDKKLCEALWPLLNEADIVIAHNGKDFDVRKINARFLKHGIKPPSPYKVVDTKIMARAKFRLNSNKLDDIGEYLGLGRKIKTDFDLWENVMLGDELAWRKMIRYCKQDVALLEKIYEKLLPWDDYHPNIMLGSGKALACPRCGNDDPNKLKRAGTRFTKSWLVERWHCLECGHWPDGKRVKKDPKTILS